LEKTEYLTWQASNVGKTDVAKPGLRTVSAHCDSCWESELVTAFLTYRIIVDSIRVNIVRSALNILGGMRMGDWMLSRHITGAIENFNSVT
jgi:hypothetical protein